MKNLLITLLACVSASAFADIGDTPYTLEQNNKKINNLGGDSYFSIPFYYSGQSLWIDGIGGYDADTDNGATWINFNDNNRGQAYWAGKDQDWVVKWKDNSGASSKKIVYDTFVNDCKTTPHTGPGEMVGCVATGQVFHDDVRSGSFFTISVKMKLDNSELEYPLVLTMLPNDGNEWGLTYKGPKFGYIDHYTKATTIVPHYGFTAKTRNGNCYSFHTAASNNKAFYIQQVDNNMCSTL